MLQLEHGKFYVVENVEEDCDVNKTVAMYVKPALGNPVWYLCGREKANPFEWYKPLRKVKL